ncbi:MAG TPA: response regulator transcription factor [Mobilitalea sp.]|nr:response regulator transcription factor [Mobilitalea sp.]
MKTILIIEDDRNLNKGICLRLEKEGYRVYKAFGVEEAASLFQRGNVDLVISDITLEDGNGMDFCREIRRKSKVYILFLTAMNQEIDIVNGYDIGADDYITKPFSLMVLTSKVNALMRRLENKEKSEIVSGDIRISLQNMKVYQSGQELSLSKKELQILLFFMENAKKIVSKEQLLEHIWDNDGQFVDENTISVNISRLRSKLKGEDYIQNVRGMGYLWIKESIKE